MAEALASGGAALEQRSHGIERTLIVILSEINMLGAPETE
jgi:hypothetical protein